MRRIFDGITCEGNADLRPLHVHWGRSRDLEVAPPENGNGEGDSRVFNRFADSDILESSAILLHPQPFALTVFPNDAKILLVTICSE